MPGFELIGDEEFLEIKDIFDRSKILFRHSFDHLRNGVYKVRDFEKAFAEKFGVSHSLGVSSGTAALRVALAAFGVKPGDEIITQSFTFVATVEAIIESGAIPVITEIDETLNMDPEDLKKKISSRTKGIIPVHMLGTPARLTEILQIAKENGLWVLEDSAWGCGGKLGGKPLGTIGDAGAFSFDFAKTMTTGEGGMIVTTKKELLEKAAAYHDHGHENNPNLPRWEDSRSGTGFNYRMSELQGAVGLAQLKKLDFVVEAQRKNAKAIQDLILTLPGITMRKEPENSYATCDSLTFFVKSSADALKCRENLLKFGIGTKILPEAISWHFAGLWEHLPSLAKAHGGDLTKSFPVSRDILCRAVSIPVTVKMEPEKPQKIHQALVLSLK